MDGELYEAILEDKLMNTLNYYNQNLENIIF